MSFFNTSSRPVFRLNPFIPVPILGASEQMHLSLSVSLSPSLFLMTINNGCHVFTPYSVTTLLSLVWALFHLLFTITPLAYSPPRR